MDDTKDIQKNNSLSVFLDGQTRTNPFGLNRAAERAYRRAERICAAAYLLTSHIPGTENIRGEVRVSGTGLLSDALALRDDMRSLQSKRVLNLQLRVRHMISLIRVLSAAGFISEANANTMTEALDELGNFTSVSQRSALSESVSISREDLMDIGSVQRSQSPRRVIKDTHGASDTIKDSVHISDNVKVSNTKSNSNGTSGSRVQNILEILRVGGSLGIRDIASNLPEYSEKMIQRELLGMVARGQIRKIGLKRWSKYSLAQ
ncbi:hypothetical protein A3C20_00470 [Candidatus Kaiserbacteria bacterium RIFCSPHIGHO2_02_FULL_55_25]|uniref:HTH deoR-type domain-containing protein n=1 Tax=Candidatus Kaiserbacteria bacterium RIFCSPHIGHO2_02_FULL_55_25 TaxID=1798498 RepID=A0A1F6E5L2_9BACT|nr:MAG: hypothetical protein A2764_02115 [Candidatus Kaiserbacteria bacterium RIFCSPHIGHO2_01_FULL_55_79]OGG68830.1 MAG: hypothetical protein A3C20_00470 [Candidatus Kaiserbacteria bacterium RIFCSPHIGHO2_02_FULL_55_25]OGG77304.1 MAG: hypothetical protein A3F56_04560 [Candidatus Kaiserbacteria bacterium RIFCSPHIGHO2_12_FULL_55_13]OGG84159.1 MAG: hypothetical protein A3A42_01530 [Candidatus Kaiserbacteria bacterium RIFCSPLOWO2_01_FULL_55_25]